MIDVQRLATDAAYWLMIAPEGAEYYFYTKEPPHFKPFFAKTASDSDFAICEMQGGWTGKKMDDEGYHVFADCWHRIPRPQPQSEWVDGLPPEGVECELNLYGYWFAVTVLAYGKTRFIYEVSPGQVDDEGDLIGGELDGFLHDAKFRPIPTPEQRQREELEDDLSGILPFCEYSPEQIKEMAEILYAQGYRKP